MRSRTFDSTGRRRWSAVEGDLEAADKALRAIKTKLDQGQKVVPSNRPFGDLAYEWYEREKGRLRPNTRRNYETALRLHVLPSLGKLKPAEVTEDRVAGLIRVMEKARPSPRSRGRSRRCHAFSTGSCGEGWCLATRSLA
jgi:Phage integrase, N-terminal SAM-like domain